MQTMYNDVSNDNLVTGKSESVVCQSGFSQYEFLSDYLTEPYTGKSKKKFMKNHPQWGWNPEPPYHQSNEMNSRNKQSPTCEVVHKTNKAHFRNLLPNRFLPSSVGRA